MWNLNLRYVGFPITRISVTVLAKVREKFPGCVDLVDGLAVFLRTVLLEISFNGSKSCR